MKVTRIWFDPPHVHWGRVIVTAVLVSIVFALWVAQRRGLFEEVPARVVAVASAPASAVALSRPAPASEPVPRAAPAAARAASSAEIVCGLGTVDFDAKDGVRLAQLKAEAEAQLQVHRQRVLPGWLEEMKSSPDVQVQAAAWRMELRRDGQARLEAPASADGALDSLDALARLAQRSRDPLVYAWAMQACDLYRGRVAAPTCAALNVEAWAERDPGNAFVWLFAAGQPGVAVQQRTLYLERALAAEALRSAWGALQPVLARAAPRDEPPLDRSVRLLEATADEGFAALGPRAVLDACQESVLAQGARRQQCERLAVFLTERADTLDLAIVGRSIGERLGWSADRVSRLKMQTQALQALEPAQTSVTDGCAGLARAESYFAEVARYGELGALRRRQAAAR